MSIIRRACVLCERNRNGLKSGENKRLPSARFNRSRNVSKVRQRLTVLNTPRNLVE